MNGKHPLDFDALEKGVVITREDIEKIFNVRLAENPNGFRFCAMQLVNRIEQERADLLARVDGDTVRVMSDVEADDVTYRRVERGVRAISRNAQRRAVINRSEFDPEQLRTAETRDRTATFLALFTRKELAKAKREERLLAEKAEAGE